MRVKSLRVLLIKKLTLTLYAANMPLREKLLSEWFLSLVVTLREGLKWKARSVWGFTRVAGLGTESPTRRSKGHAQKP